MTDPAFAAADCRRVGRDGLRVARYPILRRYILCVNLFQSSMANHSVPYECLFLHRKCLISGMQKIRANGSEPIPL